MATEVAGLPDLISAGRLQRFKKTDPVKCTTVVASSVSAYKMHSTRNLGAFVQSHVRDISPTAHLLVRWLGDEDRAIRRGSARLTNQLESCVWKRRNPPFDRRAHPLQTG